MLCKGSDGQKFVDAVAGFFRDQLQFRCDETEEVKAWAPRRGMTRSIEKLVVFVIRRLGRATAARLVCMVPSAVLLETSCATRASAASSTSPTAPRRPTSPACSTPASSSPEPAGPTPTPPPQLRKHHRRLCRQQ